jgi:hypothetical protein
VTRACTSHNRVIWAFKALSFIDMRILKRRTPRRQESEQEVQAQNHVILTKVGKAATTFTRAAFLLLRQHLTSNQIANRHPVRSNSRLPFLRGSQHFSESSPISFL